MEWLRFGDNHEVIQASCSYNDLPEEFNDCLGGNLVNKAFSNTIANDWGAAWNAHDLPRVLQHYTEDFQMISPFIARIAENASGTLIGKEAVGNYWAKALQKYPDLHFTVHEVLFCVNSVCICYDSILGLQAVEWLLFDESGLVVAASGSYNRLPM